MTSQDSNVEAATATANLIHISKGQSIYDELSEALKGLDNDTKSSRRCCGEAIMGGLTIRSLS